MYNRKDSKPRKTTLRHYNVVEGETIENKVDRIINNKEPIKDAATVIYTDRKDGVRPEHDIRTDRFDLALDAMDAVHQKAKTDRKKRIDERTGKKDGDDKSKMNDGGAAPTGAVEGGA